MSSIDGYYSPFDNYPGYSSMAPCMRGCDHNLYYNGCDQSRCWCTKPNIELRLTHLNRCASSSCTFANMNTQTDVDLLSGIYVMYCADKGFSPAGLTMPSTAESTPTSVESSARETGGSGTGTGPKPRSSGGPTETGSSSSNNNNNNSNSFGGGGGGAMSTGTKAGIGIGAAFCALVAILIVVMLLKRRKRNTQILPPPSSYQNNGIPPPQMAPTPYSGNGPFTPPPLQQPAPIAIPQNANIKGADVSPIEEKTPAAVTISRKEVKSPIKNDMSSPSTPAPAFAHIADNGPREVHGSVPPPRHEVGNDGQITNTVSTRGMELDANAISPAPVNQYPGQQQYQQSGQGQWGGYGAPAYEVEGGWNGQQQQSNPQQQVPYYGQHGTYEMGSGR